MPAPKPAEEPAPKADGAVASPAPTAPASEKLQRTASYWFLAIVTIVGLALDLGTKEWAKNHFESISKGEPRQLVLIDGFMQLIFAKNRGGAWGLLQNETDSLRRPFFLIVSVVAIVFIVSLYRKLAPGQTALKWGLPLVLGGALGNLVDRIRYGYVVDFIDVFVTYGGDVRHWPTFNVADIAICVGVGLMAIDMFTSRKPKRAATTSTFVQPVAATSAQPPAEAPPTGAPPPDAALDGAPKGEAGGSQSEPPAEPA
ncbi:MAG: signal peptidase II [Deltaproteobacteria bacterium]|nr:signal peptidase II [Deltaproteobacteria bacterium]MBW2537397.1 signal peptidase II [Deltaproteobacteria bacterium]